MLANCSDSQAHAAAALQFFHASEHLLRRIVRHTRYKSRFLSPVTATDEERESSVSEVLMGAEQLTLISGSKVRVLVRPPINRLEKLVVFLPLAPASLKALGERFQRGSNVPS